MYDPFNDGRSKLSFFYGRYYEAIPLNVAARYFGGEGILVRNGIPFAGCANPNPYTWTGAGECRELRRAAESRPASRSRQTTPPRAARLLNNGRTTPCSPTSRGSTTTRSSPPPSARSSRI